MTTQAPWYLSVGGMARLAAFRKTPLSKGQTNILAAPGDKSLQYFYTGKKVGEAETFWLRYVRRTETYGYASPHDVLTAIFGDATGRRYGYVTPSDKCEGIRQLRVDLYCRAKALGHWRLALRIAETIKRVQAANERLAA